MKYRIERNVPIPAGAITRLYELYPCQLRRVGDRLDDGSTIIEVCRKRKYVEYMCRERNVAVTNKPSNVLSLPS